MFSIDNVWEHAHLVQTFPDDMCKILKFGENFFFKDEKIPYVVGLYYHFAHPRFK